MGRPPVTAVDWGPLRHALAACRSEGIDVPFWWRDDDATHVTPALQKLAQLAERVVLPVHLAIIPAHASPDLPAACAEMLTIPVIHGWSHTDHSGPDEKKNEFLTPRATATEDSAEALSRMRKLFTTDLRRMFVPPWNRISAEVVSVLSRQGYQAISTFGPRPASHAAPGLRQVNTHLDPIWWRGTRDLIDPDQLIGKASAHVTARIQGEEDQSEPFGILTHHLVHTPAIWSFVEEFVHEMLAGGATPWVMENHI